jgi:hypothetical protein
MEVRDLSSCFRSGCSSLIEVGTDVLLVEIGCLQVLVELEESLFDPNHEFLLHDVAVDSDLSECFYCGSAE